MGKKEEFFLSFVFFFILSLATQSLTEIRSNYRLSNKEKCTIERIVMDIHEGFGMFENAQK